MGSDLGSRELNTSANKSDFEVNVARADQGSTLSDDWSLLEVPPGTDLERKTGLKYKIAKVLWDSADKSPKERKFLLKLDLFFLSSIMLGYFIKTLNQYNINTAYINGMKQHLNLKGNDLNIIQSMWTVGYIIGQVPSNLILHRVSARYYLGGLELVWCALTLLTVLVNSYSGMCAIRFFVGLTESGFFPGVEYLIGSWYTSDELTKRSTLFAQSGIAASMVTGYIQAAIIKGLSHNKLTPYKWLFVIDGIISFPVALYTMVANPNTPETTTSWYFTEEDKIIARLRRKRIGAKPKKDYTWSGIRKVFSTWHVYVFPLIFLAYNNTGNVSGQPTFQSWLESKGYTPVQYNVYPTAVNGAGIGFSLIIAWVSDWYGGLNYPFLVLFFVFEIIGCALLAVWNIPNGLHWFCYFLTGVPMAWGQPMVFSWINRILRGDNEKRNLVVVLTNNLAYVTNAWVPILTWKASDMPRYYIGWTYTSVLSSFGLIVLFIAIYLVHRDEQQTSRDTENQILHNSTHLGDDGIRKYDATAYGDRPENNGINRAL